jgi:hypothetical protein
VVKESFQQRILAEMEMKREAAAAGQEGAEPVQET